MELVKKLIHMNRWKGNVTTQITLDDDFIVPDTLDDMAQVMLDTGEVQLESVRNQGDKVLVKGRLEFQALYRRETGGLQALGGSIPFEEAINVPELEERDYTGVSWMLEDLHADMIHSRKLGVQAIITLQVRVEALRDVEAAVDTAEESGRAVELQTHRVCAASIAVRRRDTYRVKDEVSLTGGKPNIGQLLWREIRLRNVAAKPRDGRIHLEGELTLFAIYRAEDDTMPIQWIEEVVPFAGDMEMGDVKEEQIPMITVWLAHRELEPKPDYDGEMRELEVEAVLELDIKLYEEQEIQLLSDMYSNRSEILLEQSEACFDRILTRNVCRSRIAEKVQLPQAERILQICHSEGTIKLDEVETGQDSLQADGVLEVTLLYLTSDDASPVRSAVEQLPFRLSAEAPGITGESVYQLDAGLEQLSAVMTGGGAVEVKAVIALDFLVLDPVKEQIITGASEAPLNLKALQELPGIVGYVIQPGDSLWTVAKKFHTTEGDIIAANELADDQVKPGQRLLLVKEVSA